VQTPEDPADQPGGPPPVPDHDHPGQVRASVLSGEGSQAGHEGIRIPAPVGMVGPDELPAPALGFLHPALTPVISHPGQEGRR
jgi:hypothetical protein